jgi:hypothetical protein
VSEHNQELKNFKKLLEYFVAHLDWIVNEDEQSKGYVKYIQPLISGDSFLKTGQGYAGDKIQQQVEDWDQYGDEQICINIQSNYGDYKSSKCYLNWKETGVNIIAVWKGNNIVSLRQEVYVDFETPVKREDLGMVKTLSELQLFEDVNDFNTDIEVFYENFFLALINYNNREKLIKKMQQLKPITDLLHYKKQIILQGPPGTGKTRRAKEIAKELVRPSFITANDIRNSIKVGQTIISSYDKIPYTVAAVTDTGVHLKLENGSIQQRNYDHIIQAYKNILEGKPINGGETYQTAIARYLYDTVVPETQFKIIQFHPSYSYEDFVRGIVAKPNPDGKGMLYDAENKTLGEFAKQALSNYLASSNSGSANSLDLWVNEKFEDFKQVIEQATEESEVNLSGEITIFKVEHDNFRYGKEWATPSRINFTDFKKLIKAIAKKQLSFTTQQIPKELSVHAHYRNTYYMALLKKFDDSYQYNGESYTEPEKNYVLIIDEINRANLSSVLGELIYALEYRGEKVESMYDADGKDLVLPPNLYIIGTMNTADRSVGHIDYAIRRRFAFVDVPPERLQDNDEIYFNSTGYDQVKALFNENNVSKEFDIKDVQIGHSYFIAKKEEEKELQDRDAIFKLKMNYEVVPILLEYVKDGILINSFNGKPIKDYIIDHIKVK